MCCLNKTTTQVVTFRVSEFLISCRLQLYNSGYNTRKTSHECQLSSVINAHMVTAKPGLKGK